MKELRRLWPYIKRHKRLFGLGLLFITLSNICSTYSPKLISDVVDSLGKIANGENIDITMKIVYILLLTIGSGFFMFATRRTIIVASRYVEEDLRNDFVHALKIQDQKFFTNRSTGSLIALFTNDISAVREFMGPAIMYTANTITMFAFVLSMMFILNTYITLAIMIPIPIIAFTTYRLGKKIHSNYKTVQEHYESITTHAQETFSGVRVVRAYSREKQENAYFADLSREYFHKNMRLVRINALMMPAMSTLFNISYLNVLFIGGYFVIQGSISLGNLTQFFVYLSQLIWPIAAIGWVTSMIQRGAASIGRISAVIENRPVIAEDPTRKQHEVKGAIAFNDVSLDFGNGNVLTDVSFSVPSGTSLGIVGHVGSGKSSIINLIPRLYDTTKGTVTIDGIDVRDYSLLNLRSAISVVPQESFLFSETIRENIRFGNPLATDEQVLDAAEKAQLVSDLQTLPDGFDTVVGERGITLSGGQKQRTSLARAIIGDPEILILDDSLSAVDTDTESRILNSLAQVMQGRTTIIIAHRVSAVKDCTNIIVLSDGEIVEEGNHLELIAKRGIYADMVERQLIEESIS